MKRKICVTKFEKNKKVESQGTQPGHLAMVLLGGPQELVEGHFASFWGF
jgi:hypothetical protein